MGLLVGGAASQVIPLVLVPKQSPHDPVPFRALVRAWTACMRGLGWLLASRFVRPDPQNHRAVLHVEMVYSSCCLMGISSTCIGSDILLNRMELFVPPMVVFVIALSASGAICYYSLEQRHSDNASLRRLRYRFAQARHARKDTIEGVPNSDAVAIEYRYSFSSIKIF
jgi:hypothetical protein